MESNPSQRSEEANSPTYSVKAFVRVRRPHNSWVNWNHRLGGGPTLTVRAKAFEVTAPKGTMLETRDIAVLAEDATMKIDRVGWAGTPFGKRECIRISGRDKKGAVELAIEPEFGIQDAWQALIGAGVQPDSALS